MLWRFWDIGVTTFQNRTWRWQTKSILRNTGWFVYPILDLPVNFVDTALDMFLYFTSISLYHYQLFFRLTVASQETTDLNNCVVILNNNIVKKALKEYYNHTIIQFLVITYYHKDCLFAWSINLHCWVGIHCWQQLLNMLYGIVLYFCMAAKKYCQWILYLRMILSLPRYIYQISVKIGAFNLF